MQRSHEAAIPPGESGNILVAMLIGILVIGSLSTFMLRRSQRELQATKASAVATELLFTAESGISYNYLRMAGDPLYAVKNTAEYSWDTMKKEFLSATFDLTPSGSTKRQQVRIGVQYLQANAPVTFASRATPTEDYDQIKVTSTALGTSTSRSVTAWYGFELSGAFAGAIVSDMAPTGYAGGKGGAKKGNICLGGGGTATAIFGDLKSNGEIYYDNTKIDNTNAAAEIGTFSGSIDKLLSGTQDEVPDFTSLGGDDQLFDFPRFEAAAAAGAGQIYTKIDLFVAAMKAANLAGVKLEGITVLKINPATEGGSPKIDTGDLAQGINITGTLVFRFADGTDPDYKVKIETPLNVNAANLTGWNPTNVTTYTTGYPGTYLVPAKKPSAVNIAPAHANFTADDDLPAVMFNTGVVDIHGAANVCGVLYGPSFIEIENKKPYTQYFNGAIFGGGGIYMEGKDDGPLDVQAVHFDPNVIKKLATMGSKGKVLKRTGYSVSQ